MEVTWETKFVLNNRIAWLKWKIDISKKSKFNYTGNIKLWTEVIYTIPKVINFAIKIVIEYRIFYEI